MEGLRTMIIPLAQIGPEGLRRTVDLALSGLPRLVEVLGPQTARARVEVVLKDRSGTVELTGHVRATVRLTCSRCLDPVELEIDEPLAVALAPEATARSTTHDEVHLAAEELDVSFFSGDAIDLRQVLEDELMLLVPEQACEEDEDGRCTCCGLAVDEVLKPAEADEAFHPLAGLRALAAGRGKKD